MKMYSCNVSLLQILPTIHVIMQMFMLQLGHHDTVIALFCPLYMVATFIINVTAYNKNGSEYMNIPSPFFNGHCIDKHIIAIPFSFRLPTIQAVCVHACVCACVHAWVCLHDVCVHTCMRECVCMVVCVCVHVRTCTHTRHTYIYIHARAHMYTYTCTHMPTHPPTQPHPHMHNSKG